jgi:hypothetical protein
MYGKWGTRGQNTHSKSTTVNLSIFCKVDISQVFSENIQRRVYQNIKKSQGLRQGSADF